MIPALAITGRDGATVVYQPSTMAMWWSEETIGASYREANEWGLRLCLAYYQAHDEPDTAATLADVRAWAKAHSITVEVADTAPDPTQTGPSDGPSSSSHSSPEPH